MMRLKNKTAVITGGSSGIGAAIAIAFAAEGARVIINYNRSKDKAENIVKQIQATGGQALSVAANVAEPDQVAQLVKTAQLELKQIDIWVNNAGADILTGAGARLSDTEALQTLIDVDLKGTINCCWQVLPLMQQATQGNIINMTWDMDIHGYCGKNSQMFAAVKAGVRGFSLSLAKTVAPDIRVNLIAPGWIKTAFAKHVMEADYYRDRLSEIPLGRFGTPEDVANAALYLASDESAYITGQVINVNGGLI